ncbi:MAG: choice-of-anchor A family protein [Bryobacteraceae bacterium]
MTLKSIAYGALVGVGALLFTSTSTAFGASLLTPYNVFVSGNFSDADRGTGGGVGGGLAVGGVATLGGSAATSIAIASNLLGESLTAFPSSTTFIAAGGVTGRGTLDTGNYYFTGTDNNFTNSGTGTKDASDPVNFTTSMAQFTTLSTTWSTDAATSGDSCTTAGTVTTCTVTQAGMNIINVADSAVASGYTVHITGVSSADWVIINVAGTTDTLSGTITSDGYAPAGNATNAVAEDVLFNFYQATAVTLGGSVMGSVLAPTAAVTGDGGQFDGSLVAASFTRNATNGTYFYNYYFQGGQTPEPAPVACVGVGLIALALLTRRHLG